MLIIGGNLRMINIFIGSSTNGVNQVECLKKLLESNKDIAVSCDIWTDPKIFKPSISTLDNLLAEANKLHKSNGYAILIFSPDDKVYLNRGINNSEGEAVVSPRDNVIFELGLFLGKLDDINREHVMFLQTTDNNIRIFSDMLGITNIPYKFQRTHIENSLLEPVKKILAHIK